MTEKIVSRGFSGAVLRLLRAGEYRLTVTGRREISAHYLRLSFSAGGLLADRAPHPTTCIRLWFADDAEVNAPARLHQRGYTLVNPNSGADRVDIEFALHGGVASRWAQAAQPGDTIEATVLGSSFALPDPAQIDQGAGLLGGLTSPSARRRVCAHLEIARLNLLEPSRS